MAVCRFCKEEMAPEATRCPRCTSFLDGEKTPVIPGKVVYVLDNSLVTFLKYAGTILAIFLTVALSFYSLDLKKLGEAVSTTHAESQKLDISIKQAQFDLEKQKAELEKQKKSVIENVASAQEAAASASKSSEDAAAILGSIHHTQEQAEQSGRQIEEYRIRFIVPLQDAQENPRIESNSVRLDKTIEAKVLQILKMTLSASQYAAVESNLKSETTGLRRRIFDARNETNLPGTLMRSEGEAPIANPLVDQVYDRLGTVHTFFKEVVGRDISDDANGLTVTIHYDRYYNNGFWDGQQLTLGDGDGKVFKEDSFASLSVLTGELSHAVIQKTSKLTYAGQSGALNSSFSDVSAVLIEQWMSRQPAEKASWLVAPGIFIEKGTAKALRSLKEPDSDTVAAAPQVAHMSKFSDAADVHDNSGIPSKAFYEMATRLKGFAWERPAKIWYEAYWTLGASSKFQDLADATVRVATRLYGARSPERTAVVQSWAVVGIVTGK